MPLPAIEGAIEAVSELWSVPSAAAPDTRTLTPNELIELAGVDRVTIGAHTVDHVCLGGRPADEQAHTIAGSKSTLENVLGSRVPHFAYPFGRRGDFDECSIEAVRTAGFDTACTTIAGTARPSTDRFHLPRRLVMDWGRLRFRAQLQRWMVA